MIVLAEPDPTSAILGPIHISGYYWLSALLLSGAVRLILSLLRAGEEPAPRPFWETPRPYWERFFNLVLGKGGADPDRCYPLIIGSFEMLAYPILMRTQNWAFIGAWIGLKTLSQWKKWETERATIFNRFLIGNALVLSLSFVLSRWTRVLSI